MKRFRTSRILSAFLLIVMVMSLFPVSVFAGKAAISVSLPDIPVMGVGNFLRDTPIDDAAVYITVGEETWQAEGTFAWKNPDIQFKKQGKYTCVCMFIPSGSDAQLISTVSFKVPITVYRLNLVITELPQAAEIPVGSMLKDAELTGGDAINFFEKNLEIEGHFEFVEPEEVMEDVGEFERAVRFKPDLGRMYNPTVTTLERDAYGNFLEAFVSVNVFDPNAPAEEEAEEETLETGEEPVFAEITEPAEEIKEIEESAEPAEEPVEPAEPAEESAEPAEEKLSGIALAESILKQPGRRIALTIKELPTVSGEAKKGERLDTLTLEGGSAVFYKAPNDPVKGRFVWYDGSTEIGSEESCPVIFIPENTSKYNPATVTFERVNGKFLDAFVAVPLAGGSESAAAPEAESESADKPELTQLGYELADELMKQPGRRIALTIKELPTVSGEAKKGERLDTLTLEGGSAVFYKAPNDPVKGRFVWYDGSTEIGSEESYPVIFIPENTSRYNPATVTFERVNGKFLDAFVSVNAASDGEDAAAEEAEPEEETASVSVLTGREQADAILSRSGVRIALTVKELPTVSGELKKGERLDSLKLEGGCAVFYKAPGKPVAGHFEWLDGSEIIDETGELKREVVFIPDDARTYNPATVTFERGAGREFLPAAVIFTVK